MVVYSCILLYVMGVYVAATCFGGWLRRREHYELVDLFFWHTGGAMGVFTDELDLVCIYETLPTLSRNIIE